jgi:signal transduction histidine kinase
MTVKEALFNTLLHGEASSAQVQLSYGPDAARATVSDDGLGSARRLAQCLEQARSSCDGHHRGLANIEARLGLVGGRLLITDVRGGGVRVQARVPVGAAP